MDSLDIVFVKKQIDLLCLHLRDLKEQIIRLEKSLLLIVEPEDLRSYSENKIENETLLKLRIDYYKLLDKKRQTCQRYGLDPFYGEELSSVSQSGIDCM